MTAAEPAPATEASHGPPHERRPWPRWMAVSLALLVAASLALFAANGLGTGWRVPESGSGGGVEREPPLREVRVLAWNLWKAGFHEGGFRFASVDEVRGRLERVADVLRAERSDLVFLSEVVMEAGPCPLDQVAYLAQAAGFAHWAAGENYSFGLPFYRIRSGNALLSRLPLAPLETMQLAGARPFWSPEGNRRILWCEVALDGSPLLVGSVRNDSFDIANNLRQTEEILDWVGDRPALLAGDFNAEPDTRPMALLRSTNRFVSTDTPGTWPAGAPRRRIDHILAPASWTLVEEHLVDAGVSDHLGVAATFRLP
jgi:endonuclease/exonuclease/phosphatase family metal-dependent hydrolase